MPGAPGRRTPYLLIRRVATLTSGIVRESKETIVATRFLTVFGAGLTLALAGAVLTPVPAAYAANGTLSGTLTRDGEPAAGVLVGWFKPSTGTSRFVFTGSDGSYSVGLPGAGAEYIVSVNATEDDSTVDREASTIPAVFYGAGDSRAYAYQKLTPYTSTGADDSLDLTVSEPATIRGGSKAFARGTVYLENVNGDQVATDEVGSDGKYEFRYLVPGTYVVVAYDPTGTYLPWRHTTTVTAGQVKKLTSSSTLRKSGVITGRISSGGKPVAGTRVHATRRGAVESYWYDKTDSDGRYRIVGLTTGRYDVQAGGVEQTRSARFAHRSSLVEVASGASTRKNLSLVTGGKIFATITGEGSEDYTEVYLTGGGGDDEYFYLAGSGRRSLAVSGLSSGTYRLVFVDSSRTSYAKKAVSVTTGESSSLGTFSLAKKTITVRGTLQGGTSDDNRYITIAGTAGTIEIDGANAAGQFRVSGVVPGAATITVSATNRDLRKYSATFSESVTRNYRVGAKLGHVTGSFRVGDVPLTNASISWESSSGSYVNPSVFNGKLTSGYGRAGSYGDGQVFIYNAFQSKSPYYLQLPSTARSFTLRNGETTKLGTVDVAVRG